MSICPSTMASGSGQASEADVVILSDSSPNKSSFASMSPEFATRSTARPGFSPGAPVYSPVADERQQALGGYPRDDGPRRRLNMDMASEKGASAGQFDVDVLSSTDSEDLTASPSLNPFPDARQQVSSILGKRGDGRKADINTQVATLIVNGSAVRCAVFFHAHRYTFRFP